MLRHLLAEFQKPNLSCKTPEFKTVKKWRWSEDVSNIFYCISSYQCSFVSLGSYPEDRTCSTWSDSLPKFLFVFVPFQWFVLTKEYLKCELCSPCFGRLLRLTYWLYIDWRLGTSEKLNFLLIVLTSQNVFFLRSVIDPHSHSVLTLIRVVVGDAFRWWTVWITLSNGCCHVHPPIKVQIACEKPKVVLQMVFISQYVLANVVKPKVLYWTTDLFDFQLIISGSRQL